MAVPDAAPYPPPLGFGVRRDHEDRGIIFAGTFTADLSRATQGFNTRTDFFVRLLYLRLNVQTEPLIGLPGGTYSVDDQNQSGRDGAGILGRDVQGFDNINADGRSQVCELWYQQTAFGDRLRVKVGKVDVNSEFAFAAAPFVQSSFGITPTILVAPTYPDPATSVNVFARPIDGFTASFGIYDGSQAAALNTGSYGPKYFLTGTNGYFLIGELTARWKLSDGALPDRLTAGGLGSTSSFFLFDGTPRAGTGGTYAVAEQTLYHPDGDPDDPRGITAFAQFGDSDRQLSAVSDYYGAGVVYTGPLPIRPTNAVGIGYVQLSRDPNLGFAKPIELSAKLFYSLRLTRWLILKPDVQYIANPAFSAGRDAIIITIRGTVAF